MHVITTAVLGLLVGSFLNVVVWRVPRGESVVRPPSACPACSRPIRRRDNVPVVSWLLLRGRCRDCSAPISARYPLVEAATAAAFALVAWRLGATWELPAYLWLTGACVALVLIDLDVHRLPDAIVLPSYPVVVWLLVVATLAPSGAAEWGDLARAGAGGAILFAAYFVMAVAYPGGMGFGDVKLAGLLGVGLAWLGWGSLVVGGFAAFLLGGLYSLGLLALRRAGRGTGIPFGPWMVAGGAVGVAVGEPLWRAYLGLLT
ncbi:peptidase A24 [Actinotalea ferrariae CF5-4]|uniref:Prepilin leader peptidase/N-methyltransferase n=1 Tax=Actinotalea ferrariae CF5-4 TaxID=948458 RepID=A0A021VWP3_9CELL|nr:A24 family peptidase [Actinotalea ferrariae]EYR64430.1 peptidase A24 [Actinotalea ferrariae CF5-4]